MFECFDIWPHALLLILGVCLFIFVALPSTCDGGEYMCRINKRCINGSWKCDGEDDCGDGSDEESCPGEIKILKEELFWK